MKHRFLFAVLLSMLVIGGCQTVQTTESGVVGASRTQRMMFSSEQMNAAAVQSYQQTLQEASAKGLLNRNAKQVARVSAITNRLIPAAGAFRPDSTGWRWEVNVISSKDVNAWCMPGGKMVVYSGLIDALQLSDAELAAVMAHEIAHALREHGREKASQQAAQRTVIGIGAALLGVGDDVAGLANIVGQVTYGLPNSREFEREADHIGVEIAARAGYDPHAAITLWQKMAGGAGGSMPSFLNTHPSPLDRIQDLQQYAQRVMPLYQAAQRK